MRNSGRTRLAWRSLILASLSILALVVSVFGASGATVHASGNPPAHSVDKSPLNKSTKLAHGATHQRPNFSQAAMVGITPNVYAPPPPSGGTPTYDTDPIIFVHGADVSDYSANCSGYGGYWTNTLSYLQSNNQANWHPGIGGYVAQTGGLFTVGYYNIDSQCSFQLSTTDGNSSAGNCNNLMTEDGQMISNSDSRVGTTSEPIEHIACELSWYVYDNFSAYGINVKIVAHSMGGLVVRYMIEKSHGGAFAPHVDVSDVVTFSTPHGGITYGQTLIGYNACGGCYQVREMEYDPSKVETQFMQNIKNNDHPDAQNGTDWTMIGSLSNNDYLDWASQATYMSNTNASYNNHRIGYSDAPSCPGLPGYPGGYGHGNYMNDGCEGYDASYYYCDGCSRNSTSFLFANKNAPHSLHEMLFAFSYYNW